MKLLHAGERPRARETRIEQRGMDLRAGDEPMRPRPHFDDHLATVIKFSRYHLRQIPDLEQDSP